MSAFRPPLDMRRRSSGRGLPTTTSLHPVGHSPDKRASGGPVNGLSASITSVDHVKSPGELTVFVDKLLIDLEAKFEQMSSEVLDKMNQMSNRIDNLEHSIAEIISTNIDDEPLAPLSTTGITNPPMSGSYVSTHSQARRSIGSVESERSRSPPQASRGAGGGEAGIGQAGRGRSSGGDAPSLFLTSPSLGDMGDVIAGGGRGRGDDTTEDDSTIRAN